jgi:ElaB/YqjD/DUF883 family membrane-anchored ribosome-binding protein
MARPKKIATRYEEAKKKAKDKANEYAEKVDEMIIDKPRESMMVAFGAGALIGAALVAALIGRKR